MTMSNSLAKIANALYTGIMIFVSVENHGIKEAYN